MAQWFGSDLRRRRKRVNGTRLMQRVTKLIGIRIEAPVINLNLKAKVDRHKGGIGVAFTVWMREADKNARVIFRPSA